MRCYDAIIKEMEEVAGSYKQGGAKGVRYSDAAIETIKVQFLQEKLQKALQELDQMTGLAEQKTDILAELTDQLRDDLKFQGESVVMSIDRNGKPGRPGVTYTLMITTATGNVKLELNGCQFQTLAEVCRLHKALGNMAEDGAMDYSGVSISQRDIGMEATLHT